MSDRLLVLPGRKRWPEPGTYSDTTLDGERSAVFSCPDCGARGHLAGSHEISDSGDVNPSVKCDCGFHRFITLQDWDGGA